MTPIVEGGIRPMSEEECRDINFLDRSVTGLKRPLYPALEQVLDLLGDGEVDGVMVPVRGGRNPWSEANSFTQTLRKEAKTNRGCSVQTRLLEVGDGIDIYIRIKPKDR